MAPPVLLDVSIPMYAGGSDHPYRAPCVWILEQVSEGRLEVAVNTETIQEVLHRYGALQRWQTAIMMASNLIQLVSTVYPVQETDARLAIQLFGQHAPHGVKARDLIHAAVMRNNGLTQIISTDRHFDQIEGITRLDPNELYRAGRAGGGANRD
ncbi:MAG: type II toxin-antitoxin system VapC family toxin [Chloroflexi bacterium]|nr:type II toxin-antitoxin system VapC family toxin [Chloroflexota bacterium]